eukprot:TRINITY_DN423_c0_g1_i4.p1 TRINITY_DN423_c0_g1~~TRINITY_DN423_c0_g1_i4.p1  ORF type:complete len:1453 (-),score=413.83 TRINITY_DN423_c0_g1_i4:690-5048(-)
MEGGPGQDSWTTVEKKTSKKKVRDVSKDQGGSERGQSSTGNDRKKKDSVTSRSDRGDRRPQYDNRDRRSDRGGQQQGERGGGARRPPSGRGASNQRNTLPRRPREGGQQSGANVGNSSHSRPTGGQQATSDSKRSSVTVNPWEALAASSTTSSATSSPRKQSWASLAGTPAPREASATPPPPPANKPSSWAAITAPTVSTNNDAHEPIEGQTENTDKKNTESNSSEVTTDVSADTGTGSIKETNEESTKPDGDDVKASEPTVDEVKTPEPKVGEESESAAAPEPARNEPCEEAEAPQPVAEDKSIPVSSLNVEAKPFIPSSILSPPPVYQSSSTIISTTISQNPDQANANLVTSTESQEHPQSCPAIPDSKDEVIVEDIAQSQNSENCTAPGNDANENVVESKKSEIPIVEKDTCDNEATAELVDSTKNDEDLKTSPVPTTEFICTDKNDNPDTKTETKETVTNDTRDSNIDNKSYASLDNDQNGLRMKIDKDEKDENLDANGNNVSLDSNKNKVSKGMTPDMEDLLNRIDPGTRQYDRDILLMLQKHPLSLQKPDKLPELEIVLNAPMRSSSSAPLLGDKPAGAVAAANSFVRPGGMPTKRDSRRKEPKKVISISREPVKLRKTDNAWKANKDNSEIESLGKKVRAILNKLTPQKFQTLVVQFKELEIDTEEKLKLTIDLVFEKAVEEPAYSKAYASLCKELSNKLVRKAGTDEVVDFLALLLRRCQAEFQKDYLSEEERNKYKEDLSKAESEDEKKRVKAEFELLESKMRKRSLGNIRFVGELYIQHLLKQRIMHQIINTLLGKTDEESLECLCRFLTTCGAQLEVDKKNVPENMRETCNLDLYFSKIKSIVDEKKTSSRVRFMLQDVIELRGNKWINKRRKEAGPKTIDEVHKEAKLEMLKTQLADSQHDAPVARRSEEKVRRKTEFRPKPVTTEEGWNNVPTKAAKMSLDMDPEKLRSIRKVDPDSMRLGGGFTSWGMGSSTSAKAGGGGAAGGGSRAVANRYQLLEDAEQQQTASSSHLYAGRASEPVIRSVDRSSSRASASLDKPRPHQERDSLEKEDASGEPSTDRKILLRGDAEADTETLRSKFKLLLREYISNCDFQETLNSICEIFSQSNVDILVEETVNQGLEEIEQANRTACGRLLVELVHQGVLTQDNLFQGMAIIFEIAEDMIIDIPRFWEFFADILVLVVVELSCINTLLQSCTDSLPDASLRKKFLSSLFQSIKKTNHDDMLARCFTDSKSQLEDFLSQDLSSFLEETGLSVADKESDREVSGGEKLVNGNLQESLHRQLVNLLEKQEDINEEFQAVDRIMRDKPKNTETIRTLVYTVMESVVLGLPGQTVHLEPSLLVKRVPILKKYIDANKEKELYAMFALQSLVHKLEHPKKLLHNILEILYDNEVLSDDGIFDWEKSENVDEQEGKGVAVAGCKQFLEWLRNADEEEDDDSP